MKNSLPKSDHTDLNAKEENNIPSPCSVSQNIFHTIKDPGSDERPEGVAEQTTGEKNGGSETKFTAFVPLRKKE